MTGTVLAKEIHKHLLFYRILNIFDRCPNYRMCSKYKNGIASQSASQPATRIIQEVPQPIS